MSKSRDIYLTFQLHHCRGWQSPSDLFAGLRLAIASSGLIPLENQMIRVDGPSLARPVVKDVDSWLQNNYRTREEWDKETYSRFRAKERLAVSFRAPLFARWQTAAPLADALEIGLDAGTFGAAYSYINFLCMISGKQKSIYGTPVATVVGRLFTIYEKFALPLVDLLRPEYAVLTDRNWSTPYGEEIVARIVKHIFWWNYFGPDYVAKYSETLFLDAPGWRKEKVAGGILYQVTESPNEAKDPALQERIGDYFSGSGIRETRS